MTRTISFSEVSSALTCPASWDFRYGDRLAGSSLRPKARSARLDEGRAWGRAVAAWHAHSHRTDAVVEALNALDSELDAQADQARALGMFLVDEHELLRERMHAMLLHHVTLLAHDRPVDPIALERLENEILVPVPSRGGVRGSTRYKLQCFVDGITFDNGRVWLVEFKLRARLTAVKLIQLSRQIRWYAWAYERATGQAVAGVLVDERLNEVPNEPRMVSTGRRDGSRRPSHASDQLCTATAYIENCERHEVEPLEDTVATLAGRKWSQRVPVVFTEGELREAGEELVSAARLISMLDSGLLYPMRNSKASNCNGCKYLPICDAPQESQYVDLLMERRQAKRYMPPILEAGHAPVSIPGVTDRGVV